MLASATGLPPLALTAWAAELLLLLTHAQVQPEGWRGGSKG